MVNFISFAILLYLTPNKHVANDPQNMHIDMIRINIVVRTNAGNNNTQNPL